MIIVIFLVTGPGRGPTPGASFIISDEVENINVWQRCAVDVQ